MAFLSTFSIVAFDPQDHAWGIAVASKFLAAGSVVPWARAGAGAVATQAFANTSFGPRGLQLMESGLSASETLNRMISEDAERHLRQVGIVDLRGEAATFTGESCQAWAGGLTGPGFAAQGNILVGKQVVEAMAQAFTQATGALPGKLHSALLAGDLAGGDRRGRQSAAIVVVKAGGGYGGFNDRWVDFRVDDHPDPVIRLGELLQLHELYFGKSQADGQLKLQGEVLVKLQRIMSKLGYYHGNPDGIYSVETRTALEHFIGNENFEERTDLKNGMLDQPVYDHLLQRFTGS